MKTVDYHDATQHAVRRGHFAEGGMPEEAVNPILAGLRRRSDPKFNASERDLEQDQELQQSLHPEMPSNERIAGLNPMPPADLPEGPKEPIAPKQPAKPVEAGLTAPMDNTPINNAPLPTGIAHIARLIHAGEGTGQNPDSSAKGPYQFIDGTFVDQFRKNYPDRAKGMSKSQIISLKYGPEGAKISSEMGPRFIADNAKTIQRGGHTPDAGNVYLAHFLGAGTALKVLNADPSAPISRLVEQDQIDANKILRNGATAGSVINWARGLMAKKERELSRKGRASGGLAGRDGYAEAGAVTPTYTPSQQEQIDFEEKQRQAAEKAEVDKLIAKTPITTFDSAPGIRAVGLMPSKVVEPAKAEGSGALPTATAADLARIGTSPSAPTSGLAVTNGAIGRSTNLAGTPSIAPGLVGTKPSLQSTNGAFGSASDVAGTRDATQKTAGLNLPTATPEAVNRLVEGKPAAAPVTPKRGNVFDRIFGYDKSKPAYDPKTNNSFFQRLGHGETDAVLAALKGIAAMGTAPTRDLGVALAAGIGSGAGAFQEQREFGRKERETAAVEREAQSGEMKALSDLAVAEQNIKDLPPRIAALRAMAARNGPDAAEFLQAANDLQNILNRSQETLNKAGKAVVGAATPYVAPVATNAPTPTANGANAPAEGAPASNVPAPVRPKAGSVGDILGRQDLYGIAGLNTPGTTGLAELAKEGLVVNPDGSFSYDPSLASAKINIANPQIIAETKARNEANFSSEYIQGLIERAPDVSAALVNLNTFDRSLAGLKNRAAWQGQLGTALVPVFNLFNNISNAFRNGNIFDTSNIGAIESALKDQNRLRDSMAQAFNGTAGAQVMANYVESNPSVFNSPEGTRRMIATVRQANRAVNKQMEFAIENRNKFSPYDLDIQFRKQYPSEYWLKRGEVDYELSRPEKQNIVEMIRKQPDMNFNFPGTNINVRKFYEKSLKGFGGAQTVLDVLNNR
jgi:hypothetical protein